MVVFTFGTRVCMALLDTCVDRIDAVACYDARFELFLCMCGMSCIHVVFRYTTCIWCCHSLVFMVHIELGVRVAVICKINVEREHT